MISRLSVIRYGLPSARGRSRGRGGIDWFTSTNSGGGGFWSDLVGSVLDYIPRWRGPAPEPPDFSVSDVPMQLPRDLPVPNMPRLPTIWDIGQPDIFRDKSTRQLTSKLRRLQTKGYLKPRRMQCTNQRALKRAISRIKCFQKLVKRSHVFTTTTAASPAPKRRRACKCQ